MTDLQERRWRRPQPDANRTGTPWPPPDPANRHGSEPVSDKANIGRLLVLVALAAILGYLYSWWAVVVILGFLVMLFVHELGHYLAARRAGMKVTEFFLGFGPRIWSFRRGEVEYGLKAIPLGAYVRIIGMNNLEEVDPADEPRTYRSKNFWDRFCVGVAGVAMNFALALVLLFIALVGYGLPKAENWQVGRLTVGGPAALAGVAADDRIVAIDGQSVSTFDDLTNYVRPRPGQTVTLTIERDGQELTKQVTLGNANPDLPGRTVGFLGIGMEYFTEPSSPLAAVPQSFVQFGDVTYQSVTGLARIFSPGGIQNYADTLSGSPTANQNDRLLSPVGAVKVGTEAARAGASYFLFLFAAINIFVGLMNLIPLLPFDGGHIAIAAYEAIRSRPGKPYRADIRKLLPFSYAILAVLLVLFVGNFYLDLVRL